MQRRAQVTKQRRRRSDPAPTVVVPRRPVADTSTAGELVDRIDRLVNG